MTRVEPSLQAAFVEYGGNRQGFLAFAEIHPDYYQIPVSRPRRRCWPSRKPTPAAVQEDDIENFEITGRKSNRGLGKTLKRKTSEDTDSSEETMPRWRRWCRIDTASESRPGSLKTTNRPAMPNDRRP